MKITNVSVEHYDRGIPLKGWDSVKAALNLYAGGRTDGSRATEQNQIDAVAQSSGIMGLGIYLIAAPHMQDAGNQFVENMLEEAKSALKNRDNWNRSYDYDGMGVFFKTSVGISILDRKEDLYMLEISAAYVGTKPEAGLAENLGIPLALRRYSVIVQVKPVDATRFAFDFDEVLQALKGVLKINFNLGKEIAKHFIKGGRHDDCKPWPIFLDENVSITLAPGRVEQRFVYDKPGEPHDTWTVNGSVLYGLLDSSYEDSSKKEPPTIVLTITNAAQDRFGYGQPIWDENLKDKIDILSNQIAEAMKKI
jgi:hypothetical protein